MTPIALLIETFLRDTLACQRGASRHTNDSYASSFQLLFVFAAIAFAYGCRGSSDVCRIARERRTE